MTRAHTAQRPDNAGAWQSPPADPVRAPRRKAAQPPVYRRFHALRIDIAAVILITLSVWLLPFLFPLRHTDRAPRQFHVSILHDPGNTRHDAWGSPTLFAFRSDYGFSPRLPTVPPREIGATPPIPLHPKIDPEPFAEHTPEWLARKTPFGLTFPPLTPAAHDAAPDSPPPQNGTIAFDYDTDLRLDEIALAALIRASAIPSGTLTIRIGNASSVPATPRIFFAPNPHPQTLLNAIEHHLMRTSAADATGRFTIRWNFGK